MSQYIYTFQWLNEEKLIPRVLSLFSPDGGGSEPGNAGFLLVVTLNALFSLVRLRLPVRAARQRGSAAGRDHPELPGLSAGHSPG